MQPINIIEGSWKQGVAPKVVNLTGTAFMEEAGAHTFRIRAQTEAGAATAFTGTVSALFLRSDNTTVSLDGVNADGVAEVTLVSDCYHVPGRFSIAVYVSDGVDSTCVYAAVGNVYRTSSDAVIDSGSAIPSLAQLQAAYEACVQATTAAQGATTSVSSIARSLNIYDKANTTWEDGNIDAGTGQNTDSPNYKRTGFIPIDKNWGNTLYAIRENGGYYLFVYFYDANETFIAPSSDTERRIFQNNSALTANRAILGTAAYMRLVISKNYVTEDFTLSYAPTEAVVDYGEQMLVKLVPPAPLTDGTYALVLTVTGGKPNYVWQLQTTQSES